MIYFLTYPSLLSDKFMIIGVGYLPTPDYYIINERSLTSQTDARNSVDLFYLPYGVCITDTGLHMTPNDSHDCCYNALC